MNLYLLKRRTEPGYDENSGFVIWAQDEECAMSLANALARKEGPIWNNPDLVSWELVQEPNILRTTLVLSSSTLGHRSK